MTKYYWLSEEDRERQQEWLKRTIRLETVRPERSRRHRSSVSGEGDGGYRNDFKVIPGPEPGTVRVIDGGYPPNIYCGDTDCGKVVSEVLETHYGTDLWLILQYDAEQEQYTHSFMWEDEIMPYENHGAVKIAFISREGEIVQRWTGGMIYWTERYFV